MPDVRGRIARVEELFGVFHHDPGASFVALEFSKELVREICQTLGRAPSRRENGDPSAGNGEEHGRHEHRDARRLAPTPRRADERVLIVFVGQYAVRAQNAVLELAEDGFAVNVRKRSLDKLAMKHALSRGALQTATVERGVEARNHQIARERLRRARLDESIQTRRDANPSHGRLRSLRPDAFGDVS